MAGPTDGLAGIFHTREALSWYGAIVAQISNLLYRRFPIGRLCLSPACRSAFSGLETRDTADWKSALPWRGFCYHTPPGLGRRRSGAFSILECLVYASVLMVILGLLFTIYYRADSNHRNLSRNAADIVRTLQAGECWRQDIRRASGPIQLTPDGQGLNIPHTNGMVRYTFMDGSVWRQTGQSPGWQETLAGVANSRMEKNRRQFVTAWRWEVELESPQKVTRVLPLFTFEAPVPKTSL